ncbi:MAG: hypothetical protein ABR968_12545 [Bacteroidales bacterium]|jgi:hypothetical protein
MAIIENPFGLKGTMHGMNIYQLKDGRWAARSAASSPSKSTIKNSPRFAKIRENRAQFATAGKDSKLLRHAVLASIHHAFTDYLISGRFTKYMLEIMKLDKINPRGERTLDEGLKSAEGKAIMKSLNFNIDAELGKVLLAPWTIDSSTYTISIPNFVPSKSLKIPKGATHFSIRGATGHIDFTKRTYRLQPTNEVTSGKVKKIVPVHLTPLTKPEGTGFTFFVLGIRFFKMANNALQSLNKGNHDALAVIEVL